MELLSARGLTKYYRETHTLAVDRASISLQAGEIRAVVGENGAGKSSLARMIAGIVRPDSGEILARGRRLKGGVRAAESAGIGFVPQVSLLAPSLSVAENIALGREPRSMGFLLSRKKAYVEAALLIERFGLKLEASAPVASLSPPERRMAEVARALARGGDILLLDEPTSILSEAEAGTLFELLRRLAGAGKAVLLVTHRLSEVKAVTDAVTVLREGKVVADLRTEDCDEGRLSELMARLPGLRLGGERVARQREELLVDRLPAAAQVAERALVLEQKPALELKGLVLAPGAPPVSLNVFRGEVLLVLALAGNGLDALEAYASGLKPPRPGLALLQGKDMAAIPRSLLRSRLVGYAPSDRENLGLCLPASLRDNALALRGDEFGTLDWIGRSRREEAAREANRALGLSADPGAASSSLSGGNRQRLLLARELDRPRPALVLAEPLQGLDLEGQAQAAALIRKLADSGSAVLVLASSAEELGPIANRVIALYRGAISFEGPYEGRETAASLLAAMTGVASGSTATSAREGSCS
jgi:ABC-type sugar transport system, ATPase component